MIWEGMNLDAPEFLRKGEPPAYSGLIYAGRRHMLSGPPEALKTMIALIIGLELQRSSDDTFALLDFENGPYATRQMLDELGATHEEIGRVMYIEPDAPPSPDDVAMLIEAKVKLAVFDASAGAFSASGLEDNKRIDVERFSADWIDPLWRYEIATLMLDHVTKNADTRGKFAIGSERKHGRADVHLGAEVIKQLTRAGEGRIKIVTHKDRPGYLHRPIAVEFHVDSDYETHALEWKFTAPESDRDANGAWQPTHLMESVSQFLEAQTEAVSCKQITDEVAGRREYLLQAVDALLANGNIQEQIGLRGARLISVISSYRAPVPEQVSPVPGIGQAGPVPDLFRPSTYTPPSPKGEGGKKSTVGQPFFERPVPDATRTFGYNPDRELGE